MEIRLKLTTDMVKNKKQESIVADESFPLKWSDKRIEEDEGLRTVECLRGRLLAERAASKAANDESEQISKKVTELENQLKMEIKSRNKAEKRLKFLMKKLDSLNISYVTTDESSIFSEKSEISSVSSSKSQHQIELEKPQYSKRHNCPSHENNMGSLDEAISENSNENVIQSSTKDGDEDDIKKEDNNGSNYYTTKNNYKEESNQDKDQDVDNSMALVMFEKNVNMTTKNDEDQEDIFDTSMALVVVDSMVKEDNQEVSISNGNVKDVLDALRYARESLQSSMDMRRHIEANIAQARIDRISC